MRKARRAELEQNVADVVDLRDSRPGPELASVEAGRSRIVQKALADLSPGAHLFATQLKLLLLLFQPRLSRNLFAGQELGPTHASLRSHLRS